MIIAHPKPDPGHVLIERPRLTSRLDSTTERVLVLLAPAGYGKTTLARQWFEGRTAAWYTCDASSVDVATLAMGLAAAFEQAFNTPFEALRQRLRVTEKPQEAARVLADLLIEPLADCKAPWLVIDNYDHIIGELDAEDLVATLLTSESLRVLVTSRERPHWASARQVIYGEVAEISANDLLMTEAEATAVFAELGRDADQRLIDLAAGWPAMVALLARSGESVLPPTSSLSDYLADEVCRDISSHTRDGFALIAITGALAQSSLVALLGDSRALDCIADGMRRGILQQDHRGALLMHDVIRAFLIRDVDVRAHALRPLIMAACRHALENRDWDQAFAFAQYVGDSDLLAEVIKNGCQAVLEEGRTATLRRWIECASGRGIDLPELRVVQAELAFRDGLYVQAEALAIEADAREDIELRERFRALTIAGRAAHLAGREKEAIDHYRAARACALNPDMERIAAWGELAAAVDFEAPYAPDLLGELAATQLHTPDDQLRLAGRSLSLGTRFGRLEGFQRAREARQLVPLVEDPYMRTSFLNSYGYVCAIAGDYDEALDVVADLDAEAIALRLDFVIPYSLLIRAIVSIARRQFTEAEAYLDRARDESRRTGDGFVEANAGAIRARGLLARGAFGDAVVAASDLAARLPRSMAAELMATRALALICGGNVQDALGVARDAEATSSAIEVPVLVSAVRCIAKAQSNGSTDDGVDALCHLAKELHYVDGVIAAYRGFPDLARRIASLPHHRKWIHQIMVEARDHAILKIAGLGVTEGGVAALSPREAEVFRYMVLGQTNRMIAEELVISEATVKAHVHHIFEKLGVRNRSEAMRKVPPVTS